MKKIVLFLLKAFVVFCAGAWAAMSYLAPTPTESGEQPSRAQVVFDFTKANGHFNIGISWRKVEDAPRTNESERIYRKDQF